MDTLSLEEIEEFKKLEDIQVVFDIGVRLSTDYIQLKPEAEFHLFEPYTPTFNELVKKIGEKKNVFLNNYGLGESIKTAPYNKHLQAFIKGGAVIEGWGGDIELPIKTLDGYIEENNITRIDFLKIDAEGYDIRVLEGGKKAIEMARYIQFETWNNIDDFKALLGDRFTYKDINNRNIFCERRTDKIQ